MRHRHALFLVSVFLILAAAAAASPAVFKIKVTAEIANVRIKPFIGSNIIRQLPEGTILEAARKEGEWFLINLEPDETGSAAGYVHESFVLALEDIPAEAKAPIVEKVAPPETPPTAPPVAVKPPPVEEKKPKKETQAETVEPAAEQPAVYRATKEILAEAEEDKAVFISLWGGGGLTAGGDLNRGAEGLADFFAARLDRNPDQDVSPARWGYQAGGELGFQAARGIMVALGAEYMKTSRESSLLYAGGEEIAPSLKVKPEIEALPLRVSLIYHPARFLYLRAGAEYILVRARYRYVFSAADTLRDWQGKAASGGAGFIAGVGLDYPIGRGFYLTAEVNGRYAKISGFSGTNAYLDESLAEAYVEEGRLYAYEARTTSRTACSLVFIRDRKPADSGVSGARDAVLNLTGITLHIGLKFKF